jgi:hypothetical protein
MAYAKRSKRTQSTEASISHWEMELIQADEKLRQSEREQVLHLMSMLMRHDKLVPDEFGSITTSDPPPAT